MSKLIARIRITVSDSVADLYDLSTFEIGRNGIDGWFMKHAHKVRVRLSHPNRVWVENYVVNSAFRSFDDFFTRRRKSVRQMPQETSSSFFVPLAARLFDVSRFFNYSKIEENNSKLRVER